MFVQSTLSNTKAKPNFRRVTPGGDAGPAPAKNAPKKKRASGRKKVSKEAKAFQMPKMTPWKLILGSVLLGLAGVAYINHVFSTQKSLAEFNTLQRQYEQVRRDYADRKFTYDRMVGPSDIYSKARGLGFVNSGATDPVIVID